VDEHERQVLIDALKNAPLWATKGRIAQRPDLTPLFGQMTAERMRDLHEGLLEADRLVRRLGEVASDHVGESCSAQPFELSVTARPSGYIDLDLSAFLDCADADIAFEVSLAFKDDSERPPPWPVEAWVSVHCTRRPRASACTHRLMVAKDDASTPEEVVRVLQEQIRFFTANLPRIPPEVVTGHDHDDTRTWP
jgi:hypothetical protein